MALTLTSLQDLSRLGFDEVIDVRSPAEYAEDHLPGAVNLPVLDDAERARVGTVYVQESRFLARRIGAALVARNSARHLEGHLAGKGPDFRSLVYCWRGGQRSGAFATILKQIGWRVEVLEGGYRSYRRLVQAALYEATFPAPVVVLDGNTGTAKTELLGHLAALAVQVLDLEALANHRGSLFGARPGGQPSQKGFESRLAVAMAGLDPARPVVVEAESSKVGDRVVPPALWAAMKGAPRIEVAAPLQERARYLARAYAYMAENREGFAEVLDQLRPYHAAERVEDWHGLLAKGALEALAGRLMAEHYDPRYARHRARMAGQVGAVVQADDLSEAGLAAAAARIAAAVARVARPGAPPPDPRRI
ncbi:MAG: tRNA 2-selenouridine(34) synthase MnmH [Paracoccaceae bacterium]|nr:tRNA 2-selenouridine(34) synthase MnmH [Paracoccaceae bacterium]